ncbi:MAG: MBL fold metallo-hydrolase [Anaerolineae bacterium]|nr:MBL fold metallo-hydrolase [Anaerolineae bacterium]
MEITWYGHSCFRITERNMATVVTDPYDHNEVGYAELKLKADIVTVSHDAPGHNHLAGVKGADWQITGPGEYEIGGVFLTGVPTGKSEKKNGAANLICLLDYNGINVVHLGDMRTVPTRSQIEALGSVDVLLVPVGGGNGLNAAKAAEVISMLEPGIVIPMHYSTPASKLKLNSIDQFLKEMGLGKNVETLDSLKIAQGGLPEETRVVLLAYEH